MLVMSFDLKDPPCLDLYTRKNVALADGVFEDVLFFTSAFYKTALHTPKCNDGLIDIRMAVSRDGGRTADYPPARDARRPYVSLGVNSCANLEPAQWPAGMPWCNNANESEIPGAPPAPPSSFDTSVMYMANGAVESPDGQHMLQFYSGTIFSHGVGYGVPMYRLGGLRIRKE